MRHLKSKKILIIIVVYLIFTINFTIKNNVIYTNIINPLFWIGIIIYSIWYIKCYCIKHNANRKNLRYMIIIACLYIIFYLYLGFIFGFSKSPYNHELISILKNIYVQILPIIAIELVRGIIVNRNKNNQFALIFITILLILVEIDYNTLLNLFANKEDFFKYICKLVMPLIASNILYTYLALKTSYLLPLTYRVCNKLIVLILPVLTYADWFIMGTTGILIPTFTYVLFKYKLLKDKADRRKKQNVHYEKISFSITLTISTIIVCFMLGLFKYESITILSNSMSPSFNRGDVVIFKKLNYDELKKIDLNQIIIYSLGEQNIAHRIINKKENNGIVLYQTKGDSNNLADRNLVLVQQIQGVYVFHIKYIGLPSVWLYEYFNNERNK